MIEGYEGCGSHVEMIMKLKTMRKMMVLTMGAGGDSCVVVLITTPDIEMMWPANRLIWVTF